MDDFKLTDARAAYNEFTRVWNKCASTVPGWPGLVIARNIAPRQAVLDWSDHKSLKIAIEKYFARGRQLPDLRRTDAGQDHAEEVDEDSDDDDDIVVAPLALRTVKQQRESLAMAVWALREGGVRTDELTAPRDLCLPERFRTAMRVLTDRAGGVVNRTVDSRLSALARLAASPGVLKSEELKVVQRITAKYKLRHREFLKTYEDRDQKTLDQLDDPSVMNALLALPTRTMRHVLANRSRHTVSCAFAIQRALILELWLCAPYRIGAYLEIELEQIIAIQLNSVERVLLRKSKKQSTNKTAPEHFLNADTATLLRLYIDEYRPLIIKYNGCGETSHLFPGEGGGAKAANSLRTQMNRYVRKHTSLKDWHPHLIRKIVPKIILDADPGAMEIARRTGGWVNEPMLRDVYAQRVHRASQSRYLELLEGRRLHSVRAFGKSKLHRTETEAQPTTSRASKKRRTE